MDLEARAKINMGLAVIEREETGFHRIETLILPLDLADRIRLERIKSGFEIQGPNFGQDDLMTRAHRRLEEATGRALPMRVTIEKQIPIGAGLAGGTADGAAIIRGGSELFDLGLDQADMADLALPLGSDFPYCIYNKPAIARGRGEVLEAVRGMGDLPALLLNPGFAASTQEAYQATRPQGQGLDYGAIIPALAQGDLKRAQSLLRNDLEAHLEGNPDLARMKEALRREGAGLVMMTGSGPAVFGIFYDKKTRDRARARLEGTFARVISVEVLGASYE